ncbi:MAG: dienelactone hydrolase family protein [Candidatus Acidiferrales bacterium]|jgi:dienelactone hydrolase
MTIFSRFTVIIAAIACLAAAPVAQAQQEFPPPQGKGRVIVMGSGMSGPEHYTMIARAVAELGYDVVLFDGNTWEGTHGDGVKAAIEQALQMPHALPGKVVLVGFSLGGGMELYYGAQWSDQVLGGVLWYPANQFIQDVPGWANRLSIPLLVFAGGKDHYRNGCCTAAKDATLKDAAAGAGKKFDLFIYDDADHDFVRDGAHYNKVDDADAFKKMADRIKVYFGE